MSQSLDFIQAFCQTEKFSAAQYQQQLDLEQWAIDVGGEIATSGKWEAGAKNHMSQVYVPAYLTQVLKIWRDSKIRAQMYGAEMSMLQNEKAVLQVALEVFYAVIGDLNEGMSRTHVGDLMGTRAEFVLFLLSPAMAKSQHLNNLRQVFQPTLLRLFPDMLSSCSWLLFTFSLTAAIMAQMCLCSVRVAT